MKKLLTLWSLLLLCVVGVNAQTVSDEYLDIANYAGVLDEANLKPDVSTNAGYYDAATQTLVVYPYALYQANDKQLWQTQTSSGSGKAEWAGVGIFKGSAFYGNADNRYATFNNGDVANDPTKLPRIYSYNIKGITSVCALINCNSSGRTAFLRVYEKNGSERGALVGSDSERFKTHSILSVGNLDKSKIYEVVVCNESKDNCNLYEIAFSAGYEYAPTISVGDYNTVFDTSYSGSVNDLAAPLTGVKGGVTITYDKSEGSYAYLKDYEIRIYPKNKFKFAAPTGFVITKIVLAAASNQDKLTTGTNGECVGDASAKTVTWTGESEEVEFTTIESMTSGNVQIKDYASFIYLKKQSGAPAEPAPLYVIGNGTTNGWDRAAMDQMTYDEDTETYTYNYSPTETSNYFAIATYQMTADEATADNDWSTFNGTYRYSIGADNVNAELDHEYTLAKNGNASIVLPAGDYVLTIKDMKLTITGAATPPPAATYTVAGSAQVLNGTEGWDVTNTANDLTTTDGNTYTLTIEGAVLEAGVTYEYKIVKDHAWTEAYPSENKTFTVPTSGTYTIVYTWKVSDAQNPTEELTRTGDIIYSVVGSATNGEGGLDDVLFGTSWELNVDANNMTLDGDVYKWTKNNVELTAATIALKVVANHDWKNSYGTASYENVTYDVTEAGAYDVVVTFTPSTHAVALAVTPVAAPATIPAAPAPTVPAEQVYNLLSDTYGGASNGFHYEAWWDGNPTVKEEVALAADDNAWHITNFLFFGSEFAEKNLSNYKQLNLDVYPVGSNLDLGIAPINKGQSLPNFSVNREGLVAGQWNHITIPISELAATGNTLDRIYQIKFSGLNDANSDGTAEFYLDNIYFEKEAGVVDIEPEPTPTTDPAPAPTFAQENVFNLFSDTYGGYGNGFFFDAWGSPTTKEDVDLTDGSKAWYITGLTYHGTQFTETDLSGYDALHMDIYPVDNNIELGVTPIVVGETEPATSLNTGVLTAGQWNHVTMKVADFINLGVTMTKAFQLKFTGKDKVNSDGTYKYFIDNIFFAKAETPAEQKMYLVGDLNGWDLSNMTEMTWNETAQAFEYEYAPTAEVNFSVSDVATVDYWEAFKGVHRYAIGESNTPATLGEQVQLVKVSEGNIKLAAGTYKISVTKDFKMTVTGEVAPPPADDTYVVAGETALTGKNWDGTAEDYKMTTEDKNTYTLTVENVELTAGNYGWKVVKNGSTWIPDGMGTEKILTIDADGIYTIDYKYVIDPEEFEAIATKTGDLPEPPTPEIEKLYVLGGSKDWNPSDMTEMTWNAETEAFEYTVETPTASHYFAIADKQLTAEEFGTTDEEHNAAWATFNANNRYAIAAGDQNAELNTEYTLAKVNGTIVLAAGTYKVSVTKDLKMTVTGEVAPPPADDTYVVAGSGPATNEVAWDGTAEVNKMTTTDKDTYTLVVENVELKAGGDYQWKVVKNGNDWIPSGTDNNLTIDFTEDAIYTVTYKYVVSTGEETATVEKTGDLPVPAEKTYTVAGAAGKDMESGIDDVIFGKTWNPAIVENDMTKGDDGIYRLEKKDVELGITTVEFKVCVNHDWNESYGVGEGNAECEIAESGIYTITFTFNPETQAVNATAVKTGGGGEPVDGINSVSVFFDDDTPIYNLAGQRVTTPRQGVFIKNGKKFIVK
ncbi:MAG: hypothetical protein IJ549_01080 [Prevotella sp.]|nr:hypothetical protein [Prevotella sp.]